MPALSEFMRSNGCVAPAGERRLTHVFLNGGRARVPDEHRPGFLDAYAQDVEDGVPLYAVERTAAFGGVYRMFADLDVKAPPPPPDDDAAAPREKKQARMRRLLAVALECVPPELRKGSVTVCYRRGGADASGKTGAHMVWSDAVMVDDAIALEARRRWVARCVATDPNTCWEDVIDAAVYRNSGLRMPWSRKRGDDKDADPSFYVPKVVVTYGEGDDAPDVVSEPTLGVREWLDRASIFPGPATQFLTTVAVPRGTAPRRDAAHPSGADDDAFDVESVRHMLPPEYEGVALNRTRRRDDGSVSIMTDSRYCMSAMREHSSNHVYFVLSAVTGALHQCCFSCRDAFVRLPPPPADTAAEAAPVPAKKAAAPCRAKKAAAAATSAPSKPAVDKRSMKKPAKKKRRPVAEVVRPCTAAGALDSWLARRSRSHAAAADKRGGDVCT